MKTTPAYVYISGPESIQDRHGDEHPLYTVFVGDGNGDPISKAYTTTSVALARNLAARMANDRRQLEIIDDTSPE